MDEKHRLILGVRRKSITQQNISKHKIQLEHLLDLLIECFRHRCQPLSRRRSRPSPVPLPGFEPWPAAAKSYFATTIEPGILPTKLAVQFTLSIQTKYFKIDASHFKTAPRASVGGVEIGASRLRVSPPLPTLRRTGQTRRRIRDLLTIATIRTREVHISMANVSLFFPPHGCLSIAGGRPAGQPRPPGGHPAATPALRSRRLGPGPAQPNSGRVAGPNSDGCGSSQPLSCRVNSTGPGPGA